MEGRGRSLLEDDEILLGAELKACRVWRTPMGSSLSRCHHTVMTRSVMTIMVMDVLCDVSNYVEFLRPDAAAPA